LILFAEENMNTIYKFLILSLSGALVAMLVIGAIKKHEYDKTVVDLQNQAASMSKTIQDQQGLYEKLSLQESNVKGMLDVSNAQTKELADQLSKAKQDLQSAVEVSLQWQHAYQAVVNGTQTVVPPSASDNQSRMKVTFSKDFGTFVVSGFTLTNPAEADLTVSQGTPLKLTIAMAQDSSKAWHAYATSSDPNIGLNIDLASVNPWIDQPKWYQKIGVTGDVAAGSTSSGAGVLLGAGLNYSIGNIDIGPKAFIDITNHVDSYYGLGVLWRPFQ
jgi:hypothetical protein